MRVTGHLDLRVLIEATHLAGASRRLLCFVRGARCLPKLAGFQNKTITDMKPQRLVQHETINGPGMLSVRSSGSPSGAARTMRRKHVAWVFVKRPHNLDGGSSQGLFSVSVPSWGGP